MLGRRDGLAVARGGGAGDGLAGAPATPAKHSWRAPLQLPHPPSWRAGEADYAWDLLSSPEVVAQLAAVRARLSGGGGGAKKQSKL